MLTLIKNDPANSGFTLPTFDRAEQDRARAEKQVAINARIAELKATNPWAVAESTKCQYVARASKNLKKQLTLLFPGTKFSVKSNRFSMGNSIDVTYTDGPALNLVKPIVGAYQEGTFDGMDDSYNYDNSVESRAHQIVFGSTRWAGVSRDISPEVRDSVADWIEAKFGKRFMVQVSDDGKRSYWAEGTLNGYGEHAHIYHAASDLINATSF